MCGALPEFGNTFEFSIVTPIASFAQYDAPSALAKVLSEGELDRALTTWSECVTGRTSVALVARPDLSFFEEAEWAPKMAVMVTLTVAPGTNQAFETLLVDEVLPAMKKAGVKVYAVSQAAFGGNGLQYHAVSLIDDFAELDKGPPLVRALGPEGAAKLQAKSAELLTGFEVTVLEYLPELSLSP